jgi:hypothetical protein
LFSGSKEGTKITTWFEQFAAYATLLQLTPDTLVDHASLCLTGKAAEQWALIRKSLALHGKDSSNFEVFKAELTANFVDLALEGTVRYRLAQVRQTGTVSHYYSQFRAIAVEAVTHPVSGPEACAAFRAGLKQPILELVMKDALARQEMADLEVVVKAAQEAESLLALLAGVTLKGKTKPDQPEREEGELSQRHFPGARDKGKQRKDKGSYQDALLKLQKAYGMKKGGGPPLCNVCRQPGHFAHACPVRKASLENQGGQNKGYRGHPGQGTSRG